MNFTRTAPVDILSGAGSFPLFSPGSAMPAAAGLLLFFLWLKPRRLQGVSYLVTDVFQVHSPEFPLLLFFLRGKSLFPFFTGKPVDSRNYIIHAWNITSLLL